MSKFFINRPIVAMVISIMFVILGLVAMAGLPVAQFPDIVPPEIQIFTSYTGADAVAVEQSVATPIEQQVSGVDNMNYMYSVNASNGTMRMFVNFDVKTDPNMDLVFTQMRQNQMQAQLPQEVRNYGVSMVKSRAAPLMILGLTSPKGTYDGKFLANYGNINLYDQLLRVPGVAQATVFGAGQYAIRIWVKPDTLGKLGLTVPDIINAVAKQNTVNPAGQVGAEPVPPGQEFTYTVRAQGRLITPEEFGSIVVRANQDGSIVRLRDVARIDLGAKEYNHKSRIDGKESGLMALYQLPGSNALATVQAVKKVMDQAAKRFPPDLEYSVQLDTTRSINEGIHEIVITLLEALGLVILVVYLFLQGWRATLIPALAVPVSLIGTFAVFPLLGFSINTLSLFGLVLAIGLVVDDAIIVVEAVERHIEEGLSPREASLKAMGEVSGPVMAIALILAAVFIPTVFIPGITGRLYQQFAVTIAISVLISAFNALTLSPALCALLLKPGKETRGPLGAFFGSFNRLFGRASNGYVALCGTLIRKSVISLVLLGGIALFAGLLGNGIHRGFLPEEDVGYMYINISLPDASSLQRTDEACKRVEAILKETPGIEHYQTIAGMSLLSVAQNTYSGFVFVTLKEWKYRKKPEEKYGAIMAHLNRELAKLPQAVAYAFPPPAIQGIGLSGGAQIVLEDRAGRPIAFLAENVNRFLEAARKRPELSMVATTFLPGVPQLYVKVDRDKVLRQGVDLAQVYQTLQAFMGGYMINYFNRFNRQWQVYVEAEGAYRTKMEQIGQFYVLNQRGDRVPLSAVTTVESRPGPEFTMRYNLYRSAQVNALGKPGYSSGQVMAALEEVFRETMPAEMGLDYIGMSFQEKKAQEGIPASAIFGLSLLCVFLILAALYESWSLPLSVLLCTPVAVFGAFAAIWLRGQVNNIFTQIGLIVLIGLGAKNAILIVEFAKTRYERGRPLADAALEGARLRFRPILMTSLAFLLGVLPLAFSSGAGSIARQIMGTAVMGGTTAASVIAVFLIPVTFYMVAKLSGPPKMRGGATEKEGDHARALIALFLASVLSACMIGPDFRRPPVETPRAWRFEEAEAKDLVNTAWWKQFGDPVLDELIESALRENKDVLIAAARVEEFMGRYGVVRAAQFPQVSGTVTPLRKGVTKYNNPQWSPSVPNPYWDFQTFLSVSWQMDLWGQLRRATEAARADLLATDEGRRVVILTVVTAVAVAYTDLLDFDKQLAIARQTAKSREESFRLFSLRYDRGLVSELELRQVESEYKAALATIPFLEKLIAQQEDALSVLLGRNPGPIPRGRPLDQLVLPAVPAGLPSQLLERRPDIRQAEQGLIAANARIGVARALYFPTVTLTGTYGLESTGLTNLWSVPARTWTYPGTVTAPIFTAGAIAGQVKVAESVQKESLLRYQQVIQQAFREVEDGLIDQAKSREQFQIQREQVVALQAYARLAQTAVRERLHQLYRGARRRTESFHCVPELCRDPGRALPRPCQPLQVDGRGLGHRGGKARRPGAGSLKAAPDRERAPSSSD